MDASPIDHSKCIPAGELGTTDAHTHEGERGYWLFPTEDQARERAAGRRLVWLAKL